MLRKAGIDTARLDAEVLLAHCCGLPRLALLSDLDALVVAQALSAFEALIERRCAYEPVAYLTGLAEFWSLDFIVTPDVLIPRSDSEILVQAALDYLPPGLTGQIADLGTGSGCLALAILSERAELEAHLVDNSAAALDVARANAGAVAASSRTIFHHSAMQDWLLAASGFDMIISNPPYIAQSQYEDLPPDVRLHEPQGALLADSNGMEYYQFIAKYSGRSIKPSGSVVVEIGFDQGDAVQALFDANFRSVSCRKDLARRDRVILARDPR